MTTIDYQKTIECFPILAELVTAGEATTITQNSCPKVPTLQRALGLLATTQPAPSDEEIEAWLKERWLTYE